MKKLQPDEAAAFARDVISGPTASTPVVAIRTHPRTGRPFVNPADVERRLGAMADLVELETGDATWAPTDALPERPDVFGDNTNDAPYEFGRLCSSSASPGRTFLRGRRTQSRVGPGESRASPQSSCWTRPA